MRISIVVPAYNEENRISSSLTKIIQFLEGQAWDSEVIVAIDGATDATEAVVDGFPSVKKVSYKTNRGKGYALKQGVAAANGDFVYICDADLSTPTTELPRFLEESEKYDVVIGSRAAPGAKEDASKLRRIFGKVGNRLINLALDLQLDDTQCGFKLFSRTAAQKFSELTVYRWGYDFEVLYLVKSAGFKIKELPVKWVAENEHSTFKFSGYLTTFWELFLVWKRHVGFSKAFWQSTWRQYGRVIRYATVGFSTVGIDFTVFALIHGLQIFDTFQTVFLGQELTIYDYHQAQIPATILSLIFNFTSHKLWTFGASKFSIFELLRYCFTASINFIAQQFILFIGITVIGIPDLLTKLISIALVITWNFFLLKLIVYRVKD